MRVRWDSRCAAFHELLIDHVSGIGPKTALAVLSAGLAPTGQLDDVTITFEEVRPTNRLSSTELIGYGEIGIRDP